MSRVEEPTTLDPNEVERVRKLQLLAVDGTVELPGIGTAKVVNVSSFVHETFPPTRKTTLTLEFTHNA